jgi:hypothetical protein
MICVTVMILQLPGLLSTAEAIGPGKLLARGLAAGCRTLVLFLWGEMNVGTIGVCLRGFKCFERGALAQLRGLSLL